MTILLAISRFIDAMNQRIGQLVAWLTLAAVLVSAINATVRKTFNISSNAWLELQWYLFGAMFLLAAGYTFLRNEHVRVDVLSSRLSRRTQVKIDIFGVIFFLFPACVLVFWLSLPFFHESFVLQEQSSNTGGLIRWPAKLLVPVGFALLILAGVSHLIKCIGFLIGRCPDPLARQPTQTAEEALADEIRKHADDEVRKAIDTQTEQKGR